MDLQGLFQHADDIREFPAGHVIYNQGDPGDVLFVVLDGEVEIQYEEVLRETAAIGDIFGEMALIDSLGRSGTAIVLSDCRVAAVTEKQFLFMVQQTPNFALTVMRVLADRLRRKAAALSG